MTPYQEAYLKIIDNLKSTFLKKDADYGSAVKNNYDQFESYGYKEGLKYVLGRISEKYHRLLNLTYSNEQPKVNESIQDTLLDLANYSILALISYNEHQENQHPLFTPDKIRHFKELVKKSEEISDNNNFQFYWNDEQKIEIPCGKYDNGDDNASKKIPVDVESFNKKYTTPCCHHTTVRTLMEQRLNAEKFKNICDTADKIQKNKSSHKPLRKFLPKKK